MMSRLWERQQRITVVKLVHWSEIRIWCCWLTGQPLVVGL
jgi:hypothetical protein